MPRPERRKVRATETPVSLEWQDFFERGNFRRLVLHQSDLVEFRAILREERRREFVAWVRLRFELMPYDCSRCMGVESPEEIRGHEILLTKAIWYPFITLKT